MSEFERQLPPFRLVETQHGDDLQAVAARELGDANRWPELAWLNNLQHPYITDDEGAIEPGVVLSGGFIKVPAPRGVYTDAGERGQVYERDCLMQRRQLQSVDGDLAVIAGAPNLRQQLQHRIDTPQGQARRHPDYGCQLYRLLGAVNGPTAGLLGAKYVEAAMLSDYRVQSVENVTAEVTGDAVRVQAKAVAIEGGIVDLRTG